MGTAHKSTEDDIYKGYFIPKGALLLPNIWYVTVGNSLCRFVVLTFI